MTDAPERIWAATFFTHGLRATDQKPIEDVEEVCGYVEYIRKDLAKPERELASKLAGTLWQWLELAERTMEDHALRLDANRAADFCQGIRETKTVLAKLDKGE